jgi:hypothetical protein
MVKSTKSTESLDDFKVDPNDPDRTKVDQNAPELEYQLVAATPFDNSDWNFDGIDYVQTVLGGIIIEQGNEVIKKIHDTLGKNPMKPRVAGILSMFNKAMRNKESQNYLPVIEEVRHHSAGSIDELLKMKYAFEQGAHKNMNTFTVNSLKAGSALETAIANWKYAVNIYNEAQQNAEAIFKEDVYAARKTNKNDSTGKEKGQDLESIITFHVDFFTESSSVATAVDSYGSRLNTANAALIAAYATLLTEIQKNWGQITQGETKLLVDNRKDSLTLWTALKSFYSKKFLQGRKA